VLPVAAQLAGRRGHSKDGRLKPGREELKQERWRRVELPPLLRARLERLSRAIHRELELSDYCRLDYRLTPDGQLFFLRAEHSPRLTPRSFGRFASWSSIGFPRLIQQLCGLAWRRGPFRALSAGAS
jgi:hypothetical protein